MVSTEIPSGMTGQEGTAVGPVDATSPPSQVQTDTSETPQETETLVNTKQPPLPTFPDKRPLIDYRKGRGKRRRNQSKLDF